MFKDQAVQEAGPLKVGPVAKIASGKYAEDTGVLFFILVPCCILSKRKFCQVLFFAV
jgi:hypothetical protein